jgi:hypothetical protein
MGLRFSLRSVRNALQQNDGVVELTVDADERKSLHWMARNGLN